MLFEIPYRSYNRQPVRCFHSTSYEDAEPLSSYYSIFSPYASNFGKMYSFPYSQQQMMKESLRRKVEELARKKYLQEKRKCNAENTRRNELLQSGLVHINNSISIGENINEQTPSVSRRSRRIEISGPDEKMDKNKKNAERAENTNMTDTVENVDMFDTAENANNAEKTKSGEYEEMANDDEQKNEVSIENLSNEKNEDMSEELNINVNLESEMETNVDSPMDCIDNFVNESFDEHNTESFESEIDSYSDNEIQQKETLNEPFENGSAPRQELKPTNEFGSSPDNFQVTKDLEEILFQVNNIEMPTTTPTLKQLRVLDEQLMQYLLKIDAFDVSDNTRPLRKHIIAVIEEKFNVIDNIRKSLDSQ